MKSFFSFLTLFLIFSTYAHSQQDGHIIDYEFISNDALIEIFSETRAKDIYLKTEDDKLQWSEEFEYLNEIELYKITYWSDGLKVKGYLQKPKKSGNYPCVIMNRGGNRDFGMLNPIQMTYFVSHLANQGYIIIASNYRGVDGGDGMEEFGGAEINDVLNLIPALSEVEDADTSRIGMYGWSRGGMMTYLALAKTNQLKAAIVGAGVSNQRSHIKDRPNMETGVIAQLAPNYEKNREKELSKRSALDWVDQFCKSTPILILHGNSDWRVKADQSLELAMKFEEHRIPYRLMIFEGGDHGIREHRKEVEEQVEKWFDRFLKNGEKLPDMEYHGR